MNVINIKEEYIKLDSLLKYASLVGSGGEAKMAISDGLVSVNSEICKQRGKKIRNNDIVEFMNERIKVQSEG